MGRTVPDPPAESALCNALLVSGSTAGLEPRNLIGGFTFLYDVRANRMALGCLLILVKRRWRLAIEIGWLSFHDYTRQLVKIRISRILVLGKACRCCSLTNPL
ncbi:hypothetical protein BDV36DRAFT_268896, partial [Aspergillus pseudocaelatus]